MKLFDLMKEGALTKAARENSKNSKDSTSRNSKIESPNSDDLIWNEHNNKDSSTEIGMVIDKNNISPPLASAIPAISAIPWNEPEASRVATVQAYLESDGALVIPFGCDRRYWWWAGGQSVTETIEELEAI